MLVELFLALNIKDDVLAAVVVVWLANSATKLEEVDISE
jgi:hypothetical protein